MFVCIYVNPKPEIRNPNPPGDEWVCARRPAAQGWLGQLWYHMNISFISSKEYFTCVGTQRDEWVCPRRPAAQGWLGQLWYHMNILFISSKEYFTCVGTQRRVRQLWSHMNILFTSSKEYFTCVLARSGGCANSGRI